MTPAVPLLAHALPPPPRTVVLPPDLEILVPSDLHNLSAVMRVLCRQAGRLLHRQLRELPAQISGGIGRW